MQTLEYRNVHTNKDSNIRLDAVLNSSMSDKQKEDIKKYVAQRILGKFGKKAGNRRLSNYLQFLLHLHRYFKKDLADITEEEAENFYKDLMEDKIRKRNGLPYSPASKDEFIKALKNYLAWKWDRGIKYKKYVSWMRDTYKGSQKNAITLEEAEKILTKEKSSRNKALFMFLFDSGARIEEALNIRLADINKVKRKSQGEYYEVHIRGQKTENAERTVSLPLCAKQLMEWLEEHPQKEKDNFLFPVNYDNARKIIRLMSKRVLSYGLKPHELRHSSATYWVQKFGANNISGFYYRFGWKFGSNVANVYIKQYLFKGEAQEQIVNAVEQGKVEQLEEQQAKSIKEIERLKEWVEYLLNKQEKDLERIENNILKNKK